MGISQEHLKERIQPVMRNRYSVLIPLCAAGIIIPIVFTGPAIATPMIARDLGGSLLELGGVVNAYNVAFGSCVMAGGALADRFGRKRCFISGLLLFFLTSLLIGFAPNITFLNVFRGIEGIAGALTLTSASALIAQEFDDHLRLRAFSFLGTSFGIGLAFGPMLVGGLIAHLGWRALFFGIALASLLVFVFSFQKVNESRDPNAKRIDWWGIALFTLALGALILGIVSGPEKGWGDPSVVALLVGSSVLLLLFVTVELKSREPMLDLSLFRFPRFVGVQLLPISTGFCFVALLVYLPIWFIGIQGYDETEVGLAILPLTAPMLIVPFLAGSLSRHIAPGYLCGAGLLLAALGECWLAFALEPGASIWTVVLPMLVIGIGSGLPWGLMDGLSMSVVPKERAGMAAGIFTTMRVAGEAVAIAIIGALLVGYTASGLQRLSGENPLVDPAWVGEWAGGVASGQLNSVLGQAASADKDALGQLLATVYQHSFSAVLVLIAVLTAVCAVLCALTVKVDNVGGVPKKN